MKSAKFSGRFFYCIFKFWKSLSLFRKKDIFNIFRFGNNSAFQVAVIDCGDENNNQVRCFFKG